MKSNEKKMILILIVITLIVGVIYIVNNKKDNSKIGSGEISEELLQKEGIDINDEAYADKKIYQQDGDIIIEGEEGGKTIISNKKEETDLKEASSETKASYEISNTNVNIFGSRTSITGKIKNNTKEQHKVSINAKFYSNENRAKGSGNVIIENLKAGETQDFEIVIMGDMTGYTHKIEVEFTD